jgi:hypothetical protein
MQRPAGGDLTVGELPEGIKSGVDDDLGAGHVRTGIPLGHQEQGVGPALVDEVLLRAPLRAFLGRKVGELVGELGDRLGHEGPLVAGKHGLQEEPVVVAPPAKETLFVGLP